MAESDAVLLAQQAPNGVPRSTVFNTASDPVLPSSTVPEMLSHFFDEIYDLSPASHLSRLLKVILGDSGVGQLRKRYTYAHLSQFILTSHYNDLDALYAEIFGLGRLLRERLTFDPYTQAASDAEWEAIDAADAGYRSRVEAFSKAISWAATPTGMALAASAILGEECRVYESYDFLDDSDVYAPENAATANTWGDLEAFTFGDLEGRTWSSLEGSSPFRGRLPNSRGEFIVRPLRNVTDEERYHLTKVLSRLKPAEALLTIDARPAALYYRVPVQRADASSSYWHIQSRVQIDPSVASYYQRFDSVNPQTPIEQPRLAFSQYQGQAWSYNADVISTSAYLEDENGEVIQDQNFERIVTASGKVIDFTASQALQDPREILLGRAVSDGVLVSPVASRTSS